MLLIPGTATPPEALAPLRARLPGATVGDWDLERCRALLADEGVVFGWSAGGFRALQLAALEPARVRRVFLYEPPFRVDQDRQGTGGARFLQVVMWELLGRRRRALDAFWAMVSLHADGAVGLDALSPDQRVLLAGYRGPLLRSLFASTGRGCPLPAVEVRVGVGALSGEGMQAAAERLRAALPNATVDTLAGLDHLGPLTHPEALAAWLSG